MFTKWLKGELKARALSQTELAKRAGMSQAAISLVLDGKHKPGFAFCVRIAKPLGVSPVYVLQLAGLLPEDTPLPAVLDDNDVKEIVSIARNLPPGKRAEALRYLRFLSQSQ